MVWHGLGGCFIWFGVIWKGGGVGVRWLDAVEAVWSGVGGGLGLFEMVEVV